MKFTSRAAVGIWILFHAVAAADPPQRALLPERWALIVGVGSYGQKLSPGGDKDADHLAEALENYAGFPHNHIVVLSDSAPDQTKRPNKDKILDELHRLSLHGSGSATLLFAFSGHGFEFEGQDYLVPLGANLDDTSSLPDRSLLLQRVVDRLTEAGRAKVILLADACRDATPGSEGSRIRPFSGRLETPKGDVYRLFAAQAGMPSYPNPDHTGGFFMNSVVEQMKVAYEKRSRMEMSTFVLRVKDDVEFRTRRLPNKEPQQPTADIHYSSTGRFFIIDPSGEGTSDLMTVPESRVLMSPDATEIYVTDSKTGKAVAYTRSRIQQAASGNKAEQEYKSLSGSRVVVDSARRAIYVADESHGRILFFEPDQLSGPAALVLEGSSPSLMVLRRSKEQLYVADSDQHRIYVVDVTTHKISNQFAQGFPVPTRITGLVLSPNERLLYVGNQGGEGSGLLGNISIIDLELNRLLDEKIGDVNCPEGMDIALSGDELYVASQCGGGEDPVFFVNSNSKESTPVAGYAVGRSVAAAAKVGKLYVARDHFYARDKSGNLVEIPGQLSVIDIAKRRSILSRPLDVRALAITPDGRYLLALGGLQLNIIATSTDEVVRTIFFDTAPAGVGVGVSSEGKNPTYYVWLPEEHRLFFAGLSGIVPES